MFVGYDSSYDSSIFNHHTIIKQPDKTDWVYGLFSAK